jgi:hypothetical protein
MLIDYGKKRAKQGAGPASLLPLTGLTLLTRPFPGMLQHLKLIWVQDCSTGQRGDFQ